MKVIPLVAAFMGLSPDNVTTLVASVDFRAAALAEGVTFGFTSAASPVQQLWRQTEPQHDYVWRKKGTVCALRSGCLTKWQRWQEKHSRSSEPEN